MGVLTAGSGILQSFGQAQSQNDQARAQNEAAVNQYKQQLKIREQDWTGKLQEQAVALGQYDQQLSEFDRAAAEGFGREQFKQAEALRGANLSTVNSLINLAKQGGAAAASGTLLLPFWAPQPPCSHSRSSPRRRLWPSYRAEKHDLNWRHSHPRR